MTSRKYLDYYEGLEKNVQGRYRFKLGLVGQNLHDPYTFDFEPAILINTLIVLTLRKN